MIKIFKARSKYGLGRKRWKFKFIILLFYFFIYFFIISKKCLSDTLVYVHGRLPGAHYLASAFA